MKKFLSMVLAMVMTLSLVTVSAGAKEFPDNDQLTGDADGVYAEAVNVLSEMGIIDGDTDGNFKPKGTLTRGAASKIIACMMLGKTTAESLGTAAAPFKDVPVGSTFAGYIAYCVEQGIIDGYADGTFRPSGALTGYAFQKMLLTALGYDSTIEGYANNPNWRVNVTGRATQEGILRGLDASSYSAAEAATREQACLMALNTIKTPLVEYENKGSTITINGAAISQTASAAKYVTTVDLNRAGAISKKQYQTSGTGNANSYFVEFGEQYQPDLRRTYTDDDFGRPAYTWTWQKNDIGTYVDYSLLLGEYNTGVSGRALRELISQSTIDQVLKDEGYSYYVDGILVDDNDTPLSKNIDNKKLINIQPKDDLIRGNEEDAGMTKNGVLTQVFLNRDTDDGKWDLIITSIDTWLAKANADYNKSAEELSLTAYTAKEGSDKTVTRNLKVDVEDVPEIENVKKDDYILIQRSGKDSDSRNEANPTLRVVGIKDVEILSDATVTQFSKGSDNDRAIDKLTTGGTQYNFSQKCFYDAEALDEYNHSLLTNMTYDIYLDEYGYVIGVSVHEGDRNYVFIAAYDIQGSSIINNNATATAIFLDGSISNITVNKKDTNTNISRLKKNAYFKEWTNSNLQANAQHNRWYTYTVNTAGVYTLKPAERMLIDKDTATTEETLNSANLSLRAIDNSNYYTTIDGQNWSTSKTEAKVTRAYGNDDSIYITADTDRVSVSTSVDVQTIDDVQGVYTGVQNVKLELKKPDSAIKNPVPEHVYALYNSDNYIIAAIVLGEAQGNISNYAYIYSKTASEKYEDGYYYWTFDAIQNGEFKTYTARSKFSDTMDNVDLNQHHVMQLLFDGEYVSKVNEIDDSKFYINNTVEMGKTYNGSSKKVEEVVDVYDVGHAEPSYSSNNTTGSRYMEACGHTQDGFQNMTKMGRLDGTIYLSGNTLYVDDGTHNDTGLAIRNNTKAVLIQYKNNKRTHTEHSTIQDAIDSMRDANDSVAGMQFKGRIVAPLSNGVAQWVIIISDTVFKTGDKAGAYGEQGGSQGSSSSGTETGTNITFNFYDKTADKKFDVKNNLTAESVPGTAGREVSIAIKADKGTYKDLVAVVTSGNRSETIEFTDQMWSNGAYRAITSGLRLSNGDKVTVEITKADKDTSGQFTPGTTPINPDKVTTEEGAPDLTITLGGNNSSNDALNASDTKIGGDGKITVTVPAEEAGKLDAQPGDTFEMTITADDGTTETVTATVGANGVITFASSKSFSNAKQVKFSSITKKNTDIPATEDKPSVVVTKDSGFTAADVTCEYNTDGTQLWITIPKSLADAKILKSVKVASPALIDAGDMTGPVEQGNNLLWTANVRKANAKITTVTVDFKSAEQVIAAAGNPKADSRTDFAAANKVAGVTVAAADATTVTLTYDAWNVKDLGWSGKRATLNKLTNPDRTTDIVSGIMIPAPTVDGKDLTSVKYDGTQIWSGTDNNDVITVDNVKYLMWYPTIATAPADKTDGQDVAVAVKASSQVKTKEVTWVFGTGADAVEIPATYTCNLVKSGDENEIRWETPAPIADSRTDYKAANDVLGVTVTGENGTFNSLGGAIQLAINFDSSKLASLTSAQKTLLTHTVNTTDYIFTGVMLPLPMKAGARATGTYTENDYSVVHVDKDGNLNIGLDYATEGTTNYWMQYIALAEISGDTFVARPDASGATFNYTVNFTDSSNVAVGCTYNRTNTAPSTPAA